MIPTNQCEQGIDVIMALPTTYLEVHRDARASPVDNCMTESAKDDRDDKQDRTDDDYDLPDIEQDTLDDGHEVGDDQDSIIDDEENSDGRIYGRNRQATNNYPSDKSRTSSRYSQQQPDGSVRTITDRPVVYDINTIPQPTFSPMMRLRAQYPRLHDARGWDCRVVDGRLDKIVDPVCGQCLYDLTRYRWLKHKYDEIEPAWEGYNAHDSTLPDKLPNGNDLPGAGLRQFPGLSWRLAVINVYLCLDSKGRKRQSTWGRWPRELDYMLKQRGWTEGVDFVDWKTAEVMPATHPKQSEETPRDLGVVN